MRTIARTDANHAACMDTARKLGATVTSTHQLGGGFPDFVMASAGATWLVEVKDGAKPPSGRRLTPDERTFADEWRDPRHHIVVGCPACVQAAWLARTCQKCGVKGPVMAQDYKP